MKKIFSIKLAAAILLSLLLSTISFAQKREYYQEPIWKPRAILPYADAIQNNFWPTSPSVEKNYLDPEFEDSKLSKVPAPGIYPRVLLTMNDVEHVRQKLALGSKAPLAFRAMWERVEKSQSPFYALVTNNKDLGRKLAKELVEKVKLLDPKIDDMDKRPDRDNLWDVERSIVASGEPDSPAEIWDLLNYDYLQPWMTAEECELTRAVIEKICKNRISNFLSVPDHFMINNHQGFGMEYIRLMLLIEGQKGFDKQLFELAAKKADAMISWYLDKDGMCYESIKGWLNVSAFVAVGLRHRELLKHSNLMAKIKFFQTAIRWEEGAWKIRDEMRASAFHFIWMMHYYHPKNEGIDFLYQSCFTTHPFLTDATVRWPDPVGICNELLLVYADDGILENGKPIDWTNQTRIDKLQLPTTWQDSARGYVDVRNSWRKEDLHLGFVCKQDFFYGGHEGSENNRLTLWKDGVNWIQDNNMLATKATFLQNMLTVDGMGCHWPPAPGNWLGVKESAAGLVAAGDGKMGYSFTKIMQVHPLWYPSAKIPYLAPFAEGNFDLSRDLQIAFQPATIKWNNGFAHTDYGPWSGETRLVESYKPFNMMEQAYRTVQVAKGNYPYVLLVDDAKKDNNSHLFEWTISVPLDVVLAEASTPEVVFQNTEPSANRTDDLILAKSSTEKDPKTGKYLFKKGDPLCLIRVLWRNADYGFPVPRLEQIQGYNLVTIPSKSVSPEFRVLVYPFKYGDPMPITNWNIDRTALDIQIKGQQDHYQFSSTEGGRTVLSMKRNEQLVLTSQAKPSRPNLFIHGKTYRQSDFRYTQLENTIPHYLLMDSLAVNFEHVKLPAVIRYTLDGSEPNNHSSIYQQPIMIKQSLLLKARVFDPSWEAGITESAVLEARFEKQEPAKGMSISKQKIANGLSLQVFEINTKPFDNKGFFDASKIMIPNLDQEQAVVSTKVSELKLPRLNPTKPQEIQSKGFYQFKGQFYAAQKGLYQFDLYSCGPVTLDIANRPVIESLGLFHQQQDHRMGEVLLDTGWHSFMLVVTDPLYWNASSLDPMPLSLEYAVNGHPYQIVSSKELRVTNQAFDSNKLSTKNGQLAALKLSTLMEPGLDLKIYDRTGKRRDPDFLDIDQEKWLGSLKAKRMETTSSRNTIRVYNAYYYAPVTGKYQFQLPKRVGDNVGLGGIQASCQNQLRIDEQIIVQRGVYGRNPDGWVNLEAGWHQLSLRFGTGEAKCQVLLPEGQTIDIDGSNLFRPAQVRILSLNKPIIKQEMEIFAPIQISMDFPTDPSVQIRYTKDGTIPNNQSQIFNNEFQIDKTSILTALAFKGNQALTAPVRLSFNMVNVPEMGSLGVIDFKSWDGISRKYATKADFKVWVASISKPIQTERGKTLEMQAMEDNMPIVDVNVAKGGGIKPGFKLYDIKMRENALTVAIWFKTNEKNGKLFGKEGYNAFGKAYKTFSCSINNGRLQASPNRLSGGIIEPDKWQFLVLTADESNMAMYLNGVLVATAPGTKDLTTDALDFFAGHHAFVDGVQLYDRYLEAAEVKKLFEAGKH